MKDIPASQVIEARPGGALVSESHVSPLLRPHLCHDPHRSLLQIVT